MKIQIRRSDEYVQARRIATGTNVPQDVELNVAPADLSEETRRIIISERDEYPDSLTFLCDDYSHLRYFFSDIEPDQVTPTLVDQVIAAAASRLAVATEKYKAEKLIKEAELARQEAEEEQNTAAHIARQSALIDAYLADPAARPTSVDTRPIFWICVKGTEIERKHPQWSALLAETTARLDRDEAVKNADREDWIIRQGSDRLRRLIAEDIEHDNVYMEERLAMERPGWAYQSDVRGEAKEPLNSKQRGLDLLDEARKIDPSARLAWWVIPHEHTADCDPEQGNYCDEKTDWKGYACVSEFLGLDIVYGVPSEYAC